MRTVPTLPPDQAGVRQGLAYTLWVPDEPPAGGVVIVHGADSAKERHHDFARACRAHGMAAVVFDQRGHGASEGALGETALDDVATVAALLPPGPVALRGSSMGGLFALLAAERVAAAAVVAICPATPDGLRRGLREGRFAFRADRAGLDALLAAQDPVAAVAALDAPVLLLHAEGDEQVPVEHSRELAACAPRSRLVAVPGGHHRSVQHDPELQALALRFLRRELSRRSR